MDKNRVIISVRLKPENVLKAKKLSIKNCISIGKLFDNLIENINLKYKL